MFEEQDEGQGLNWRRVTAQSAAIALHVGAFMFLLAPVKPPPKEAKDKVQVTLVVFIEPPPAPPPPPPPPPEPPKKPPP
jgi:protein TonB